MIGLDTNVPLRNLVQDDPVQSPRATEIITSQLTEEEPGFISLVTILEVVLLRSLYKRSRPEIANDIEMVLAADTLEVQNEQQVYHTVVALRNGKGTFEDALIGALGIWTGCTATLTFDERLRSDCTVRIGMMVPSLSESWRHPRFSIQIKIASRSQRPTSTHSVVCPGHDNKQID